jgi:hypothetical protein
MSPLYPRFRGILSAPKPLVKIFLVRLLERVYAVVREAADRLGRPMAAVACDALVDLVRARRQWERHSAIATYAAGMAGTEADLDSCLEAASVECWLQDPPKLA